MCPRGRAPLQVLCSPTLPVGRPGPWSLGCPGWLGLGPRGRLLCCAFQCDARLGTYPPWTRPADTCGRRDWPSPHGHRGACWVRGVGVHPTVLRASGRQAGLLASTLRKALVPGRGTRERLRKERVSQERGAAVWGAGSGENVSPTWFLHPTQLLEMKTAVEPAFPVFHFPSKRSCIPSEPLNVFLNVLPIIQSYLPYSRGCFMSPVVQELSCCHRHKPSVLCPWSRTAV